MTDNKYLASFNVRCSKQKFAANNVKKCEKIAFVLSLSTTVKFLDSVKFDEHVFTRIVAKKDNADIMFDLYAIEQIAKVADAFARKLTLSDVKFNDNVTHTLKTVRNFADANMTLDDDVLQAAMQKTLLSKVSEDKRKLIACRNDEYSSDNRQLSIMLNMLTELKLIKHVSKNEYVVNDNAATKALRHYFA